MISIAGRLMDQIGRAAEKAYPNECCGLLAGIGELDGDITICRVEASDNVAAAGARDRFEVDPRVRFDLMRRLEGGPERIVGHYHSHPDCPAEPSGHDLEMAFEPDLVWLIVALAEARVSAVKAHRVVADGRAFCEIPLLVEDRP